MRATHYITKSLSTRGMIVTVMNPTRYNLALARAKQNYQQKVKDIKQNHDKERLKLTNDHEGKRIVDKSNHQKEVNEITENFQKKIDNQNLYKYKAMKCASLLRETMWSMVSEITSDIDFDYATYTKENLSKFEESYKSIL